MNTHEYQRFLISQMEEGIISDKEGMTKSMELIGKENRVLRKVAGHVESDCFKIKGVKNRAGKVVSVEEFLYEKRDYERELRHFGSKMFDSFLPMVNKKEKTTELEECMTVTTQGFTPAGMHGDFSLDVRLELSGVLKMKPDSMFNDFTQMTTMAVFHNKVEMDGQELVAENRAGGYIGVYGYVLDSNTEHFSEMGIAFKLTSPDCKAMVEIMNSEKFKEMGIVFADREQVQAFLDKYSHDNRELAQEKPARTFELVNPSKNIKLRSRKTDNSM